MANDCSACRTNVHVTQKRIKCTICQCIYHLDCINTNNTQPVRSQWICPACLASKRKCGDTSNTPVRNKQVSTQEEIGAAVIIKITSPKTISSMTLDAGIGESSEIDPTHQSELIINTIVSKIVNLKKRVIKAFARQNPWGD